MPQFRPVSRHNPQVRYIQRMVIGQPAATATSTAGQTLPAAAVAAAPPPPSSFGVVANATSPWTTGSYTYDGSGNISAIGSGTGARGINYGSSSRR